MADQRKFASTSNLIRFILKNKTTGQGLTGLTGSTTGLIISTICDNEASATVYTQAATHIQTIATLGTFSAPSASNCRFGEVDSTNHKGLYEFQFADARFSVSSSKRLIISVNDAEATILDADYEIQLVQFDPYDAVHLGLSALPNTAVTTNGSLITSGTGAAQLNVSSGKVAEVILVDTLTTYTGDTPQSGDSYARIGSTGSALTSLASASGLSTAQSTLNTINTNTISTGTPLQAGSVPTHFSSLAIDASGHIILQPTGLDQITAWGGVTARHGIFYAAAGVFGDISGLPGSPATVTGLDGSTTAAIVAFDTNNNRTSVTLTPP